MCVVQAVTELLRMHRDRSQPSRSAPCVQPPTRTAPHRTQPAPHSPHQSGDETTRVCDSEFPFREAAVYKPLLEAILEAGVTEMEDFAHLKPGQVRRAQIVSGGGDRSEGASSVFPSTAAWQGGW